MLSAPYAPEQNGDTERENRTVVEFARSVLSVSRLSKLMWAQACETATYVLNHTGKTCYQEISNRYVEWSSDEELGSRCVRHRVLYIHPKAVLEEIEQECVWSSDWLPE